MKNQNRIAPFDMSQLEKPPILPMICVYKNLLGKFVARLWDANTPTKLLAVADSLKEIRNAKPPEMCIVQRKPCDNSVIVETWL